jgi:molybdate transport system ATP-binding protein
LRPELAAIVGPDAVGAVLEGVISEADAARGLARLNFGSSTLLVTAKNARVGARARVQLFASDLILATHPAHGLSVRNSLAGVVRDIREDDSEAQLVSVDIGGASVLARVTRDALESLGLHPGSAVWVLVKAVSMRSHAF